MNKRKVEAYLPIALEAILSAECGIREKEKDAFVNKISKTYRSYISSFGAAVTMGSFKAAVAFFSQQASGEKPRQELLRAMWYIVNKSWVGAGEISKKVIEITDTVELARLKEEFINASLAMKLALNAFELVE